MSAAVVVRTGRTFLSQVEAGRHELVADEPEKMGGTDKGPSPYDFLAAALGTCKSMTMRMYADRKKWPLESVEVIVSHGREHAEDCAECEDTDNQFIHRFVVSIALHGDLTEEQRQRIVEIASKCPVARTLENQIQIVDELR